MSFLPRGSSFPIFFPWLTLGYPLNLNSGIIPWPAQTHSCSESTLCFPLVCPKSHSVLIVHSFVFIALECWNPWGQYWEFNFFNKHISNDWYKRGDVMWGRYKTKPLEQIYPQNVTVSLFKTTKVNIGASKGICSTPILTAWRAQNSGTTPGKKLELELEPSLLTSIRSFEKALCCRNVMM